MTGTDKPTHIAGPPTRPTELRPQKAPAAIKATAPGTGGRFVREPRPPAPGAGEEGPVS
ncbi:hypothetical protein GA0115243_10082 [Streptomyces sp. ScaeMP-e83]|nr:hypothetical protein GA0115243_10082 [Streptomyces sp. ScaeMP-e83]